MMSDSRSVNITISTSPSSFSSKCFLIVSLSLLLISPMLCPLQHELRTFNQLINSLREREVIFRYAARCVRPVLNRHLIVMNDNIGMMVSRFGNVRDRVHKSHRAQEISELVTLLDPAFTTRPSIELRKALADFFLSQFWCCGAASHDFNESESSPIPRLR